MNRRIQDPTPEQVAERQADADQLIGVSLDMLKAGISIYLHKYPDTDQERMKAAILKELSEVLP